MKLLKAVSFIAGTSLLFNSWKAAAEMAEGTYSIDLGSTVPLWDLTGEYTTDIGDLGSFDFYIGLEPSGKIAGSGDFDLEGEFLGVDFELAGSVAVLGTVAGSASRPTVAVNLAASGSGTVEDEINVPSFTENAHLALSIDNADGILFGKGSATVKVKVQYSNPKTGQLEEKSVATSALIPEGYMSLPYAVNGDWKLTLNLAPNGTKYLGTATVVTSVGTAVDFNATGSYSSKTDTSDITLKGTGWGVGSSLSLVISTTGSAINVQKVSGKVFGQSLNLDVH